MIILRWRKDMEEKEYTMNRTEQKEQLLSQTSFTVEDLLMLVQILRSNDPAYEGFYLRRFGGVPAWDLNLYVRKERIDG